MSAHAKTGAKSAERHLLLVDDEANILRSLERTLRGEGYRIHKASSGREGLELLEWSSVSVIVSDHRMPQQTGVEFLSRVKELYPDTVRIILSGYADLKLVTDAINEGAIYKFFSKPWEDELLQANIKEAFERHELCSENTLLPEATAKLVSRCTLGGAPSPAISTGALERLGLEAWLIDEWREELGPIDPDSGALFGH